MLYKKNHAEQLDTELFRAPTAEYRGTPFWAWNCKLDREQILRQIDYFKEMGFGGFHMHSRIGMASPYLGEEFMGHIKACVEKAKNEGMLAWLYDEDRWASGAAGGYLTKDKKYRLKHLRFSRTRPAEYLEKSAAFDTGKPYFLAAYDVELDKEGYLAGYRRIGAEEEAKGAKWYATVCTAEDDPWFNNQSYPDTMDEETMARFIDITYEAYLRAVGEEFDGTVPAIFTDEPNHLCRVGSLPDHAGDERDIAVAWSRFFEEKYQERYGEDLLERLPELFWITRDRTDAAVKYRYYDFCAECFAKSFVDQCGKWCEEHGIALTGHFLMEENLERQVPATGDMMRQYRSMTLPGIDILCDGIELTTAKQCQSVVHQLGREGMMAELYGVTNWDFGFKGHKFQGDWLAALGVTVRVPHLSWMSMGGEAKRDYPASIFYQAPWYKEYSYIEDHYARLNTALTRGTPDVRVGLLHPVESYWLLEGPRDMTGDAASVLDENFHTVTRWLLEGHQDFDFVNESMIPALKAEDARVLGKMRYDVIVIPDCNALRSTTVAFLEAFAAAGGEVVFMSECPAFVDGVLSEGAKKLYDRSTRVPFSQTALLKALEPYRAVQIRLNNGSNADRWCYQLRKDGDAQWLFIAPFKPEPPATHSEERGDDGIPRGKKLEITVEGERQPYCYDTLSGKVLPVSFRHEGGKTVVIHEFFPSDSLLLRFEEPHYHEFTQQKEDRFILEHLDYKQTVAFEREEDNVLLLDLAEYRLDEEPWKPREQILRLDDALRERLGYPMRNGKKQPQPWVVPDDPAEHTVSLRYEFRSAFKLKGARLALEDAEKTEIFLNGRSVANTAMGWYVDESIKTLELPLLKKGVNTLELRVPISKRSNLEACYILGDFDVQVQGTQTTILPPRRALGFGSLAAQGMPFYGGNITYLLPVEVYRDCKMEVHLGKYKGALCKVALDDGAGQRVAFAPCNVTFKKVSKGTHTLRITVYGHRHNTFGCVHNCDERYSYFGPNAWRTLGDRWGYEYHLKELGLIISPQIVLYE